MTGRHSDETTHALLDEEEDPTPDWADLAWCLTAMLTGIIILLILVPLFAP